MSSAKVNWFAKTRSCSPADHLLSISLVGIPSESRAEISHMEVCEFCRTEAHFLSRFHESNLSYIAAEMPTSLRLLAEVILGKHSAGSIDPAVQLPRGRVGLLGSMERPGNVVADTINLESLLSWIGSPKNNFGPKLPGSGMVP